MESKAWDHAAMTREHWLNRKEILHQKRLYWAVRRAQDVILSSIALILLAPIMLVIALVIVIDSPGASPFFSQTRVGRDGRSFKFYNLRWMKEWCMTHKMAGYFWGVFVQCN